VCGSRDVRDYNEMYRILDHLLQNKLPSEVKIINGAQKSHDKHLNVNYGADYFATEYAKLRGIEYEEFPAPWEGLPETPKKSLVSGPYGKYWPGAGAYRNKLMLDENPDACVGFPSTRSPSKGTKMMLKLAKDAGVNTRVYYI
tara:strand:+ start:18701 stop:19129 length:429 start_codon:yes stop_codon:yes gene_type:complete